MAKNETERIIDTPETAGVGRASQYSGGATSTATPTANHTHDGAANSGGTLAGYATASHTHDGRYYTEAEVDALIAAIPSPTVYTILTNGDAASPEIVFADGDVILVPL